MTSNKPRPCISFHVGSISSLLFSLDTCLLSQYHTPHILFISLKEFNKGIYFTFFPVHQSAIYYSYKKWFPHCVHIGPHYDLFCNIVFDVQSPFLPSSMQKFPFMSTTQQQFTCLFGLELKNCSLHFLRIQSIFSIVHFVYRALQRSPLVPNPIAMYYFVSTVRTLYCRFTALSKMEGTHLALM